MGEVINLDNYRKFKKFLEKNNLEKIREEQAQIIDEKINNKH